MKSMLKSFSIVAFVLAIMAAFAFKSQDPDPDLKIFHRVDSEWVEVTENYLCEPSQEICIAQFENDNTSGTIVYSEPGDFVPL